MGFLKKIRFWRRRHNDAVRTCDNATMTDHLNLETGTQFSSIEIILRCDAGTQVDSNLTCEASTQTHNCKEEPENRIDGGMAENEKEEMKREIALLEKLLEEKDRHNRKLNSILSELKERTQSEIQFMKEEIEKTPDAENWKYERRNRGKEPPYSETKFHNRRKGGTNMK
jgi:hypothetical protein